eukprot:CAMPEP_0170504464 /NCGR_PEP_ID=MMETSP0208-20121228/47990_1 /TAXON_ID=197538 /ORGANISM="Strombidium inclinatum, Strain S3" /LENGTH=61 /DNA_ID=CAMNT_0010784737 /DNA_START=161 /DNA_END=346 /DNA_ORIENTATION=+
MTSETKRHPKVTKIEASELLNSTIDVVNQSYDFKPPKPSKQQKQFLLTQQRIQNNNSTANF